MKNIKLENLTLIEFLELISGYNEIKEYTFLINSTDTKTNKQDEPLEVKGRITDFKKLNLNFPKLESFIQKLEDKNNHSYTEIEVYKYLKELTNDFYIDEVKIVLKEIEYFENMILFEEMNIIAMEVYINNGWEIPTYKKTSKLGENEFNDYNKMRNKVFPYLSWGFYNAKTILDDKLKSYTKKEIELEKINKTLCEVNEKILTKNEKVLEYMIEKIEEGLSKKNTLKEKYDYLQNHLKSQKQSVVTNPFIDIIKSKPNDIQQRFIAWLKIEIEHLELEFKTINEESTTYPTDKDWFKVGLEFAKGNIILDDKPYNTGKLPSFNAIANSLGNENYRPYISCTITDNKGSNKNKNIFYSKKKPQLIIDYCKENDIEVCQEFMDKFNKLDLIK